MANEISKLQFLRSGTANKAPTAAQLDEGSLAINMADKKLFSKDDKGAIFQIGYSQAESDRNLELKFAQTLQTSKRLSELSTGNLLLVKTANDNLGSVIAKPLALTQARGTGPAITRLDDSRLTETNQTWTIDSALTDGPVGSAINASVLINTKRAFATGSSLVQVLIDNSGVSFIRTGSTNGSVWTWYGAGIGADANGWRKQFDSVVLPTLKELGAAKSGANTDITSLGAANSTTSILGNAEVAKALKVTGSTETNGITNTGAITSTSGITVTGAGTSSVILGSGAADVYLRNTVSSKTLQLKDNGVLAYSDQPIYHAGNKPTAADVGALPLTGGIVTGQTEFKSHVFSNPNLGYKFSVGEWTTGLTAPADGVVRVLSQGRSFVDFDGRQAASSGSVKVDGSYWAKANVPSYDKMFNIPGVVNVNFGATEKGYFPAFKATNYLNTFGYTTQASMGLLRDDNGWGKLALFVASDEAADANHPRAVATLDATGNFNSARLSTNYLTVTGSIDATSDITTRGAVNAAGIYNTGTYYLRSNDRRHIQFSNANGSDTDGYIYKDWNGDLNLLNRSASASLTSGGNFNINGSFNGQSITTTNNIIIDSASDGPYISYRRNGSQKAYIQYLDSGALMFYNNSQVFNMNSNGDFSVPNNMYAVDFIRSSDKTIKRNIKVIENALDKIEKLNGVTYEKETNLSRKDDEEAKYITEAGFIAQELEEVLPEAVSDYPVFGSDRKLKSIKLGQVDALMLQAIKELSAKVKELEAKLAK